MQLQLNVQLGSGCCKHCNEVAHANSNICHQNRRNYIFLLIEVCSCLRSCHLWNNQ